MFQVKVPIHLHIFQFFFYFTIHFSTKILKSNGLTKMAYANSVDPDQTASEGSV